MGKDHPDAQLYPSATGAAARTIERHQNDLPLKLYAGWFCKQFPPFLFVVFTSFELTMM